MRSRKYKILFFGLGSIGLRHAKLLLNHFNVDIYAFRTKKGQEKNHLNIREFHDIESAFSIKPDIAFITNPTFLHVDTAIECAKRGIHLFIEKPLSCNLKKLQKLNSLMRKNNIYSYVAFCLRFHPVIGRLKETLENEKVLYVRNENASFLPNWRPKQDYKKTYSADPSKGGGVIFDMIHELDYNQYLFGEIKAIEGEYGKASDLDIKCEDYAELHCELKGKTKVHISLDCFSHKNIRILYIYCKDKLIQADLLAGKISIFKEGKCVSEESLKLSDPYLEQVKYFFENFDRKNNAIMNTIPEATRLLKRVIGFREERQQMSCNQK